MNKAVFLDRDGVINNPKNNYYVYRVEDFEFNTGVIDALRELQDRDYLLIVITNQGGVSKGKYSREDVEKVHRHMEQELANHGIYLSEIYYCPHHSKKEQCLCRKPNPVMLEKAMARFDIAPEQSWFIGDRPSDEEAGRRAGVNTIRIRKNQDIRKFLVQIS